MSVITNRQFEEALRDWLGDRAVFLDGWETRDSNGGFDPHGMMHHWTAMAATGPRAVSVVNQNRLLAQGRSGLPGPLAHLSPTRAGDLWVISGAHANANHAGDGDPDVYRRVLNGVFDGTPTANQSTLDGNPLFYGLEYQYHPDDGPMPDVQVETGILAAAALSEAHGWPATAAAGSQLDHYEWTPRKWDRERDDLANRTREGVRLALANRRTPMEDDMFTEDDRKRLERIEKMVRTKGIRTNTRLARANVYLRELLGLKAGDAPRD